MPRSLHYARRTAPSDPLSAFYPGESEPLYRELARGALGTAGRVFNVLDLPGSMVRDVLTLNNPLDQLLTPWSPDNRTTGREALTQWGFTRPNDPNKWELADFAGFGLEVATDPLMPLTLAGSALTKGGKLLKSAGVLDTALAGLPKRVGRMTTTFDDVVRHVMDDPARFSTTALDSLETAAKSRGFDSLDAARQAYGQMPVGGLGSYFGKPFGFGRAGMGIARGFDTAGNAIRWSLPGRLAHQTFGSRSMGMADEVSQKVAYGITGQQNQMLQDFRMTFADLASELEKHKNLLPDPNPDPDAYSDAVMELLEGVNVPAGLERAKEISDKWAAELLAQEQEWGGYTRALADEFSYAPHLALSHRSQKHTFGTKGPGFVGVGNEKHRAGIYRGANPDIPVPEPLLKHGTASINRLVRDKDIGAAIERMRAQDGTFAEDAADTIAGHIRAKYGGEISDVYHDVITKGERAGSTEVLEGRHKALARKMMSMTPEERAKGLFADPMTAMWEAGERRGDALAVKQGVLRMLADNDALLAADKLNKSKEYVELTEFLSKLGFDAGGIRMEFDEAGEVLLDAAGREVGEATGALRKLAELRGVDVTDVDELRLMSLNRIPKNLADQWTRMHDVFTTPQSLSEFGKLWDSATNLIKAHLTSPFPAFHSRNLASGTIRNFVAGMLRTRDLTDTWTLLRGGTIKGASKIPQVASIAKQRGIQLTDESATEIIRQIAFASFPDLVMREAGEASVRSGTGRVFRNMSDAYHTLPGATPFSFRNTNRKFWGRHKETSLKKPWEVRGFGEVEQTRFGPVAAGEDAGYFVEGMNRIAPLLNQMRKGTDWKEAAERILEAQVDYSGRSYSQVERSFFQRVIPFWKFMSRNLPYVFRELTEKPGGAMKQMLRAIDAAHEEDARVPKHIAESVSFPFGADAAGNRSYVTGLGLMEEDALALLGEPRSMIVEGLSRMNPLIKGTLEWGLNQSFFQRGPLGGRPLDEMDPALGRIMANAIGRDAPVTWPGSHLMESILSNSPASRYLSTARQLTDPRKSWANKITNVSSGVKVATVSPEQQQRSMKDYHDSLMKEAGARTFYNTYFPKDAELTEQQQRLRTIQRILNTR